MIPKGLPTKLVYWLRANPGWHNKAEISAKPFYYPDNKRQYSMGTIDRKLRLLAEDKLIEVEYDRGQAIYRFKDSVLPKRIIRWESVIKANGTRAARPIYE